MIGEDHTFNQQSALAVVKYAYGDGDAPCAGFQLWYQGDFVTAGGDEGGLGATAELWQDLNLFSGTVEAFQREPAGSGPWTLTYGPQGHLSVERLAAGRPIINLNEKEKWIKGTCRVYDSTRYPTKTPDIQITTGVVEVPGSTLPSVVSRFLAIDEPSERIDPNDSFSASSGLKPVSIVRRWFQITNQLTDPLQEMEGEPSRQVVEALRQLVNAALPLQSREHLTRAELHYVKHAVELGIAVIQKLDGLNAAGAASRDSADREPAL